MGQNQFLPLGKHPLGTLTLVGWPTQSEAWGPGKTAGPGDPRCDVIKQGQKSLRNGGFQNILMGK